MLYRHPIHRPGPHEMSDLPGLRGHYRHIRKTALKLMGKWAAKPDFDALVNAEIEYQGCEATAQNWVNVANDVLERMLVERGREPRVLAEVA